MEALIRLLMVVAVAVGSSVTTPRPAPRQVLDPPGHPASAGFEGRTGAPRERTVRVETSANGGSAAPLLTGRATWYDAPSIHDAAAGPGLRKALGSHWRGSVVRVSSDRHSVVVVLSDWCQCERGNRVIDLDDQAFRRLAPLSQGIVRVSITVVGGIDTPARATAPTGPPTDLEGPK